MRRVRGRRVRRRQSRGHWKQRRCERRGRHDRRGRDDHRDLLNSQPLRAIELARQANQRAPESPDAPERAWIIVKALAGLGRFHEARDAAADLASKYPDTSWAMDAKRHMLVQPLDLPSREEQQRAQQQEQQRRDQGR